MQVSIYDVKNAVRQLPLGYYSFQQVPINVTEEDESYFSPRTNAISIGAKTIIDTLEPIEASEEQEEELKETTIRSLVYHELSHAILTPNILNPTDILNIFEDERIEEIMQNYYLNVDFKATIKQLCQWKPHKPIDATDAFFQTVRFRYGNKKYVQMVEDIIKANRNLSRSSNGEEVRRYEADVMYLYQLISSDFMNRLHEPEATYLAQCKVDVRGNNHAYTQVDLNTLDNAAEKGASDLAKEALNVNNKEKIDMELFNKINDIILAFNKRTNSGVALQTYSGFFNARNFVRDDYRFFDRQSKANGANRYGTVHLNLFLDRSGSFSCNEYETNRIIQTLLEVERKHSVFNFDIVSCGVGETVIKDKYRYYHGCNDGTQLDDKMVEIFRTLQQHDTYNYNILLIDGLAFNSHHISKAFTAFNNPNCCIISDTSNEEYILNDAPNARKIFENAQYTRNLKKNLLAAFQLAFR